MSVGLLKIVLLQRVLWARAIYCAQVTPSGTMCALGARFVGSPPKFLLATQNGEEDLYSTLEANERFCSMVRFAQIEEINIFSLVRWEGNRRVQIPHGTAWKDCGVSEHAGPIQIEMHLLCGMSKRERLRLATRAIVGLCDSHAAPAGRRTRKDMGAL
tara:strand:+ start:5383 stop:5856 length:474 start_codon:yes stop_codon:yes gene_type:complete